MSTRRCVTAQVRVGACVLAVALGLDVTGVDAQKPKDTSLDALLARAGQYIVEHGRALTSVLAEESYTQRLVWQGARTVLQERILRSEMAFVRLADSTEWLTFRNVLAVDGVPRPESSGRLERLFQESDRTVLSQAHWIAGESARYNLGPVTREINVPTIALLVVHPLHRSECRFEKEREDEVDGARVWVIRFRERERGHLIRRADGRNLPVEGRLWIVPADGRVVRSELVVKDFVRGGGGSRAVIHVTWRRDEGLDLWVPAEMREHYEGPWSAMPRPGQLARYDIDGVATYSNYRRFTVDVRIK